MIGRSTLVFLILLVLALVGDALLNHGRATMFLLLKFADFVEYVSFWR